MWYAHYECRRNANDTDMLVCVRITRVPHVLAQLHYNNAEKKSILCIIHITAHTHNPPLDISNFRFVLYFYA